MSKVRLYIARHGKTMFNTIGRAQGWSDTPLTTFGELGIKELGLGLKASNISFKEAFSSDSGRTLQTMEIILREVQQENIPYTRDKRIREWCFGSLDGGYDGDLFNGVLPRVSNGDMSHLTHEEIANLICQVDTAGWAEPCAILSNRILSGFTAIAKKIEDIGGGNAIVVSHGMTIATFLWLIDHSTPRSLGLDNGSVSVVDFEDGTFSIQSIGDMSYREKGREILEYVHVNKEKAIVLAGRPYHIDPEINHGIPELIESMRIPVLSEDALAYSTEDLEKETRVLDQWSYHARLYRAAEFVGKDPCLQLVQLNSFGCGLDAVTTDQVQDILEANGKFIPC